MRELKCIVYDEDKFTKELISSFIEQTEGVSYIKSSDTGNADIVFIDSEFYGTEYTTAKDSNTRVIVISSDQKYVSSFFRNEIADYLPKSEITYARFLKAISKVK